MFTTCNAGFLDLLLSGTSGDHASICSSIACKHGASTCSRMRPKFPAALLSHVLTFMFAATCHYTPSMACETHHHAASCQPRPATFTGSNGDGTAPAVDSGIYSATGTHMLIAASIRGDEHNRAAARSACAESYRADLPEDERCGPTCVISTVVIDGGPAETCLPVRRHCHQYSFTSSRLRQSRRYLCVHRQLLFAHLLPQIRTRADVGRRWIQRDRRMRGRRHRYWTLTLISPAARLSRYFTVYYCLMYFAIRRVCLLESELCRHPRVTVQIRFQCPPQVPVSPRAHHPDAAYELPALQWVRGEPAYSPARRHEFLA